MHTQHLKAYNTCFPPPPSQAAQSQKSPPSTQAPKTCYATYAHAVACIKAPKPIPLLQRSISPVQNIPEINGLRPVIQWGVPVQAPSAKEALNIQFQIPAYAQFEKLGDGSNSIVEKVDIGAGTFAVKISRADEDSSYTDSELETTFSFQKGEICGLMIPHHESIARTNALLVFHQTAGTYQLFGDYTQTLSSIKTPDCVIRAIIQEAAPGKELLMCLHDNDIYPCAELAVNVGLQTAKALQHLHSNGFIYRDLKPENLLYDTSTGTIKLVDLGFVKPLQLNQTTRTMCGTPEFVAPEIICGKPYDHKADNFSLGMLLYQLTTGAAMISCDNYFDTFKKIIKYSKKSHELRLKKVNKKHPSKFSHHAPLARIIARLTDYNPQSRMSLQMAMTTLYSYQSKILPQTGTTTA